MTEILSSAASSGTQFIQPLRVKVTSCWNTFKFKMRHHLMTILLTRALTDSAHGAPLTLELARMGCI
jgi:hypothetical protein